MTDEALRRLSPRFDAIYATTGRPSIPPEHLLRALLPVPLPPMANVILVDGIDTPGGPTNVRTTTMDGRVGETLNPTLAFLFARSPDVVSFLPCDVGSPNEVATRAVNQLVCDDLRAK